MELVSGALEKREYGAWDNRAQGRNWGMGLENRSEAKEDMEHGAGLWGSWGDGDTRLGALGQGFRAWGKVKCS